MDKLKMHSPDLTQQNIDRIAELFPTVVTERLDDDGNPVRAIDFDLLRQELSDHVVDGPQERYQLDWPGKRAALFAANAPIAKTLRPVREESVDFDTTKNLFIEGDNLDALKLLQEPYLGKVKLVFIDPPYNTGADTFVYPDSFAVSNDDYLYRSGQIDDVGGRLVANSETNGRFHSDWLSMMYPRIKLARNLLSPDGILCVTIDDNEGSAIDFIGREVFGEANFVARVIWKHTEQSKNDETYFSRHHNYLVVLRRSTALKRFRLPRTEADNKAYSNPDSDPRGPWRSGDVRSPNPRPSLRYDVPTPSGGRLEPPANGWRWNWETMKAKIDTGEISFRDSDSRLLRKIYLADQEGRTPETVWLGADAGTTRQANAEIKELFGSTVFDTPKPTQLIRRVLSLLDDPEALVLDFFAGSASTAHAVMLQNADDGGRRQFIMVQLPEPCDASSEASRAGYSTIADLAKERIRRAAATILKDAEERGVSVHDVGFRAFEVDSTNFVDVSTPPDKLGQEGLGLIQENVKQERSAEDLLFEVILNWGLDLTSALDVVQIEETEVMVVDDGALVACFDDDVPPPVIRAMADRQPLRAVFHDSGFPTDADRINAEQIFAELSPSTEVKVI